MVKKHDAFICSSLENSEKTVCPYVKRRCSYDCLAFKWTEDKEGRFAWYCERQYLDLKRAEVLE
jgi:hypothetical protein